MKHNVTFTLPERTVGHADVEFRVKQNGLAFGLLKVSKGALVWKPANKQFGHRITWARLNEMLAGEGNRRHR